VIGDLSAGIAFRSAPARPACPEPLGDPCAGASFAASRPLCALSVSALGFSSIFGFLWLGIPENAFGLFCFWGRSEICPSRGRSTCPDSVGKISTPVGKEFRQ
jgi:hypothetical protein